MSGYLRGMPASSRWLFAVAVAEIKPLISPATLCLWTSGILDRGWRTVDSSCDWNCEISAPLAPFICLLTSVR